MNATQGRLSGKRIAVLAADGFEYLELTVPRKALELAGGQLEVVSLHPGRIRGMNLTQPTRSVRVDRELSHADADDYDALFVPGGFVGPDLLRQSRLARSFVRAFDIADKPIATLCHGPWLLVSAGLVEGRLVAAWPGIRDDVVHAGGIWRDEPVVRDRNWVTSRGPQDLHAFVPAMKELFAASVGSSSLDRVAGNGHAHDDVTSSPSRDEPPALAVAGARLLQGATLRTLTFAAVGTALGAYAYRRAAAR